MAAARAEVTLMGVVLGVRNAGEGHRVVQLLDPTHGRVGVWARHARGSRRRLAGVLEPFATVRLQAVPQGGLFSLRSGESVRQRDAIRRSLDAIGRAANLCLAVRSLWPEGQAAPEVFAGLELALDHVEAGRVARAAGLYPRLAHLAGLMPELDACSRCGRPTPPLVPLTHEPAVACPSCAPPRTPALPAAAAAGLAGARLEDAAAAAAVEACVLQWFGAHLGRALQPWQAPR